MSNKKNTFYYSDGMQIPLIPVTDLVAIKTSPNNPEPVSLLSTEDEVKKPLFTVKKYGIQVYEKENDNERLHPLSNEAETITTDTVPIFKQGPNSTDLILVDNKFIVQFKPDVTMEQIDKLNKKHNVKTVKPLGYAENGFILQVNDEKDSTDVIHIANTYYESGLTLFAHPNLIRERYKMPSMNGSTRETPVVTEDTENFLSQQWHLQTAKVIEAWEITKGNPNIKIAIADDGVLTEHPEFQNKIVYQYDFERDIPDGNPKILDNDNCKFDDCHGTACAGVATAAGLKAYGAAPNCSLMVARTPQFLGTIEEGEMFEKLTDNGADIISCSWGPGEREGVKFDITPNVRAALKHCTTHGRNGKGTIILFAAGNYNEDTSLNGYTTNPYTMSIAASHSDEDRSSYSNFGKEVLICAPSSDRGKKRIFTTDILGEDGYNRGNSDHGDDMGDYTNSFGGTSSSTPLVAGIVALMLSVNPSLKWKQVREILAHTANQIGDLSTYQNTPLGQHSPFYGYGRVNALKAVEEAQHIH